MKIMDRVIRLLAGTGIVSLALTILICSASPAHAKQEYMVGAGDVLTVTVYGYDDMKATVRVNDNGEIQVPLLGPVKVAEMPISEVALLIQKKYADGYLTNPQVNVFVNEFRSKKAVILGQVAKPGVYELSGQTTFLELISKAGGLMEKAGDTATITHKGSESQNDNSETINIKELTEGGDLKENFEIEDGDNIVINKAGLCYVSGEVKKPDAYKIDNNTTVIKAITLAGGFTGKAKKESVTIVRIVDGAKETISNVPMDAAVYPDDIIIINESFF